MSRIRMFRVNGYDHVNRNSTEFYFKADRGEGGSLICTFCVTDEGIFYYRKGSKILTSNENARARYTHDGFISMEDLGDLFEKLRKAGLSDFDEEHSKNLKITRQGKKVIIQAAEHSDEE